MYPEFEIDLKELPDYKKNKYDFNLRSRSQHIKSMLEKDKVYDLLIVGGGASGAGVALEASSRGL